MKRSLIQNFPIEVLRENFSRLEIGLDELEYFYSSLLESKAELFSTNEMLKNTIYQMEKLPSMIPPKSVEKTSRFSVLDQNFREEATESTDCGEITVSMIIQEEIPLVTRKSLNSLSQNQQKSKRKMMKRLTGNFY